MLDFGKKFTYFSASQFPVPSTLDAPLANTSFPVGNMKRSRFGTFLTEWSIMFALLRGIGLSRRSGKNRKHCHGRRPVVEQLEDRIVPSTSLGDLLSLTVTPGAHLVTAGSPLPASGSGLPPGFGPGQVSQAYGFNQITFNSGTVKGDGS